MEQAKKYLPGSRGDAKHDIDDMPDILQKLTAAKQNAAAKVALKMLQDVAETETASSAVFRSGKVVPKLMAWVSSKDPEVKSSALNCCALLSTHDTGCAESIGTPEFLTQVGNMYKAKDKKLGEAAARFFSKAAGNKTVRQRVLDGNVHKQLWMMVKSKKESVMKLGLIGYSKLADDPAAAEKLCEDDVEEVSLFYFYFHVGNWSDGNVFFLSQLVKFFFIRIAKTDDTDVEKWCLIAVARLSLAAEFGNKLAAMDKFGILFVKANDTIAGRKLPAALAIANLATNKMLRVRLIKYRALQLFVGMSQVSSNARKDMQDFQRVAALGIRNLSGSFDLRALAGKMGALEAVVKMLRAKVSLLLLPYGQLV